MINIEKEIAKGKLLGLDEIHIEGTNYFAEFIFSIWVLVSKLNNLVGVISLDDYLNLPRVRGLNKAKNGTYYYCNDDLDIIAIVGAIEEKGIDFYADDNFLYFVEDSDELEEEVQREDCAMVYKRLKEPYKFYTVVSIAENEVKGEFKSRGRITCKYNENNELTLEGYIE